MRSSDICVWAGGKKCRLQRESGGYTYILKGEEVENKLQEGKMED